MLYEPSRYLYALYAMHDREDRKSENREQQKKNITEFGVRCHVVD